MPSVWATAALGECRRGELAAARRLAEEGIAAAGYDAGAARPAWEALSSTEMMGGHYEEALVCHQHALQGARLAGDAIQQSREQAARALALGYLGRVEPATVELNAATAAVLYGALVASPTALPLIGADAERVEDAAATLIVRLGAERVERMKVEGAALGDERAIVYAADCARRGH